MRAPCTRGVGLDLRAPHIAPHPNHEVSWSQEPGSPAAVGMVVGSEVHGMPRQPASPTRGWCFEISRHTFHTAMIFRGSLKCSWPEESPTRSLEPAPYREGSPYAAGFRRITVPIPPPLLTEIRADPFTGRARWDQAIPSSGCRCRRSDRWDRAGQLAPASCTRRHRAQPLARRR
jgi:hypothetical protein